MIKDYDCESLYHPGKSNGVTDALSRKSTGSSDGGMCMRIPIDSTLLDLIIVAQEEVVTKEN